MNTQKQSNNLFLMITMVLATGVLTGCQYCQPLLMAMVIIGVIYRGFAYTLFLQPIPAETNT